MMEKEEFTWQRESLIGKGSFGHVFLGRFSNNSPCCGVPPLFAVKSAEISASASLQKEFDILFDLHGSPYIITCYGEQTTCEKGQTLYNFMMEYASGGSLADRIKKSGCLPVERVKDYTRHLLLGLARIHDAGYVHCDINPNNVLLVASGDGDFVAKIADFGLAKKLREGKFGEVNGTLSYMAPETLVDGEQDCASDIWALGSVVYEMLSGHPARQLDVNDTTDDFFYKIARRRPYIDFGLPWEARAFLRLCFERAPAHRPTAASLLEHTFLTGKEEEEQVDENSLFGSEEEEEEEVENDFEEEDESEEEEAENGLGSEEEEVDNGCEEELEWKKEKAADIGCELEEAEDYFFGSEEGEEVDNGCEVELDREKEKMVDIGSEVEEDPEELEEVENYFFGSEEEEEVHNGCEEELEREKEKIDDIGCEVEDPEELEEAEDYFFGIKEGEEVGNGCEELERENEKVVDVGCEVEEEEEDPEEVEVEEEEDPEEEVGSSCLSEDDWSFVPQKESTLLPNSFSEDDTALPASKRRKISHSIPITGGDLTLRTLTAPSTAAR